MKKVKRDWTKRPWWTGEGYPPAGRFKSRAAWMREFRQREIGPELRRPVRGDPAIIVPPAHARHEDVILAGNECAPVVNLDFTIRSQLDEWCAILEAIQRKRGITPKRKPHEDIDPIIISRALRVFDARHDGATYKEIAESPIYQDDPDDDKRDERIAQRDMKLAEALAAEARHPHLLEWADKQLF